MFAKVSAEEKLLGVRQEYKLQHTFVNIMYAHTRTCFKKGQMVNFEFILSFR